jgi:hypothetical protein
MVCPACGTENAMAYSILSNGLICLEKDCSFEIEMPIEEAMDVIEMTPDVVCV